MAKGDSAYMFNVDPNKSNAWGITYLYGCTAIMISDPAFVVGKYFIVFFSPLALVPNKNSFHPSTCAR
jgi:hypothetical protein